MWGVFITPHLVEDKMDLAEILNKVANIGIPIGVIILLGFIKIPKIELNIWKWLGKAIGKALNAEVMTKISGIEKKVDTLEKNDESQTRIYNEDKARSARRRIIQFADEIRRKIDHSQEGFNIVLNDIKMYTDYCDNHPGFKNDQAKVSIKIIEDVYAECLKENKFL